MRGRMRGGTMAAMGEREVRLGVSTMKGMRRVEGRCLGEAGCRGGQGKGNQSRKNARNLHSADILSTRSSCYVPAIKTGHRGLYGPTCRPAGGLFESLPGKSLLYARTTGYRCDYNHSKRTTGDFVHNSWGVNEPAIPLPGDRYLPEALTCTIHSSQAEFLRENGLVSWSCFPYQNRNRLRNAGVSRSRWDSEAAGVKRAEAGWGSGSGVRTPLPRSWA